MEINWTQSTIPVLSKRVKCPEAPPNRRHWVTDPALTELQVVFLFDMGALILF
jgi:hypothetical protein